MTRTIRAYNKRPLRLGPGYCGWIVSNRIPEQFLFQYTTGDYHPYQQWGHMKGWKDWRLDSRRRRSWKRELRMVTNEYARFGMFTGDFPYDFCDRDCMYSITKDPLADIANLYYNYIEELNSWHGIDDYYNIDN